MRQPQQGRRLLGIELQDTERCDETAEQNLRFAEAARHRSVVTRARCQRYYPPQVSSLHPLLASETVTGSGGMTWLSGEQLRAVQRSAATADRPATDIRNADRNRTQRHERSIETGLGSPRAQSTPGGPERCSFRLHATHQVCERDGQVFQPSPRSSSVI